MKRILLILVLLAVVIIASIIALRSLRPQEAVVPATVTGFPIASSTSSGVSSIEIATRDGSRITVTDFTKSSSTVVDNQDPTILYLNGDPGLCQAGVACPETSEQNFTTSFDTEASLFLITLRKEPLGEARREAEQQLKGALGITEAQMCELNYSVGTLGFVSEVYGGQELGFSFCPDSVVLP